MLTNPLRMPAALCATLLLFSAAGCGKTERLNAPADASGVASSAAALAGDRDAPLDASAGEDSDDRHEDGRRITAPVTITESGTYRLQADAEIKEGDAIVVHADNVRLLLGTHVLTGPGNKLGRAIVVEGVRNVLVRGGTIRRFGLGVALLDASGSRVRGVRIEGGDETADPANGNPPQIGVMAVNSARNVIAGNGLRDVNLGLFIRGGGSHDNLLLGNDVTGGKHGLLGICYNPAPTGGDAGPRGDWVYGNRLARFGTGISASAGSERNRFIANVIRYFDAAWADQNGTNVFRRNWVSQISRS